MDPQRSTKVGCFYKPELDGLRFFAFLGVFICHALPKDQSACLRIPNSIVHVSVTLGNAGALGVDLFFALSAYLITDLLLSEKEANGSVNVTAFYARRVLRIWPLYLLFVGISVGLTFVDHSQKIEGATLLGYLLFASNWVIAHAGSFPKSTITPLWSISVEEQFYLVWPWVIKKLTRRDLYLLAALLLLTATVARIYIACRHGNDVVFWTNTFSRLDPIACGTIVALALHGRKFRMPTWKNYGYIGGGLLTLLLSSAFWNRSGASLAPLVCYPIAALGVTAVLLGSFGFRPLQWKPFVELGKRSYGLYVYHSLAFYIALHLITTRGTLPKFVLFRFSAFVITVLLAWPSYRFLEQPFLRLKHKFTVVPSRDIPVAYKCPSVETADRCFSAPNAVAVYATRD